MRKPGDLRHHTLIRDGYRIDWAAWLASAGGEGVDPQSGLTFDSATFAVESAVQGEGVVPGRTVLVSADLATGRVVRPFDHALKAVSSSTSSTPGGANLRHGWCIWPLEEETYAGSQNIRA